MSYNVGTHGYETAGRSGGSSYNSGNGYAMKVPEEYSDLRRGIYSKQRETGLKYEEFSDRMKGLAEIAFGPKINIGRT